jgi:hypothetical protein
MVLAIAALILQFSPASQALVPVVSGHVTASVSEGGDETKPKLPPASAAGTSATIPTASGTGHFDVNSVDLSGNSKEKPAGLSAVSLINTNDPNSESLSTVRVPDPALLKPIKVQAAETPRMSRSWLAFSLVQHGAATFDAYSTRQAVGHGAVEDDPIMRPFAHSGAIYAAIQVGPLLLDYVARRMQHSENGFVRRMWFVPQSVSTAGFIFSGVHNLNVASRP